MVAQLLCAIDLAGNLDNDRLIYTEVIASVSIILSITLLVWALKKPKYWPIDFVVSMAWIVAFALMVNQISPVHCGAVGYLDNLTQGDSCDQWKVVVSFAFASGMAWLANAFWVRTKSPSVEPSTNL